MNQVTTQTVDTVDTELRDFLLAVSDRREKTEEQVLHTADHHEFISDRAAHDSNLVLR